MRGYKKVKDFKNSEYKCVDYSVEELDSFASPFEEEWIPSEKTGPYLNRATVKEINEKEISELMKLKKNREKRILRSIAEDEKEAQDEYGKIARREIWKETRREINARKKSSKEAISL